MSLHYYIVLGGVGLFALALNLPFGFLRGGTMKYSWRWFLYIHLPVPFVYLLRKMFMLRPSAIPFLIVASILGQVLGGNRSSAKTGETSRKQTGDERDKK